MILNFPTDRVCNCRTDISGLCSWCLWGVCTVAAHTHTHIHKHVCACIYTNLVTQWGLFPCSLCGRSRLQLPNLVLSLFWGLLDQFLIFSLFWKEWCFLKLGLELGGRDWGMTNKQKNKQTHKTQNNKNFQSYKSTVLSLFRIKSNFISFFCIIIICQNLNEIPQFYKSACNWMICF